MKQLVVSEIEGKILSGTLPCGSKLPSEAELARTLGVGRRTIREALHILQARGVIEIHQGKGAFVIRNDYDNYLKALTGNISSYLLTNKGKIENVLEIREIFEVHALRTILDFKNSVLIRKLKDNITAQKWALALKDSSLYHKTHREFHNLIIEGLNNPIIKMVYEQIIQLIEDIVLYYASVPEQMAKSVAEHEGIVTALEEDEVEIAIERMQLHLRLAYENFKKRQEKEGK